MKIEVLVATMYNKNIRKLYKEMNLKTDAIFINQCKCSLESYEEIKIDEHVVKIISSPERGISKSRNKALQFVDPNTDIIIFTDDDIHFFEDYPKKVSEAYLKNNSDGIVFNIRKPNGKLNKKIGKKLNQINLFRASSVSLTFRFRSIQSFRFDEDFGTGSGKYILGEENIFVSDCLKRGLNIVSDAYVLCQIENKRPSTWYQGMNDAFLVAKGASFKRMHKYLYFFFNFDFAIRKHQEYKKNMSFFKALKNLFTGSFSYNS